MLVSLNWLKKYVDVKASPEEISETLTSLGIEVEEYTTQGEGISQVVIGKILKKEAHPDADKLSLCQVTDGTDTFPVVCGAPNVAEGQTILFAKVGARLPGNFKIKKSKIRGCESLGMICAVDELGLGQDHSGIKVLPEGTPLGIPFQEVPDLCDTIFDLSITPNRPDALCHVGVARELAGHYGLELQLPKGIKAPKSINSTEKSIQVNVESSLNCSLYTGRIIRNVKVGPSPQWLVNALEKVEQKSINNIVDITNYVLLEYGQPSHAFDMAQLKGNQLNIRLATDKEKMTLLDGKEVELSTEDLVIADVSTPKCLAGVMGGLDSGVTDATQDIFLEVAYFKPQSVRKSAKTKGLSTDSSYRFERGVDPLNTEWISAYLVQQIEELTGGQAEDQLLVCRSEKHPTQQRIVELRLPRIQKVLGLELSQKKVIQLLEKIDLKTIKKADDCLSISVPGYRVDIEREIDLIEEVARLFNYNNIPTKMPLFEMVRANIPESEVLFKKIRMHLASVGLNECLNLRFLAKEDLDNLGCPKDSEYKNTVDLLNPLNSEWQVLPTTLLPNLLKAVNRNQRNQEKSCRFFEGGKVFYNRKELRSDKHPGVEEELKLSIVLSGPWEDSSWNPKGQVADFFILKGIFENLFSLLNLEVKTHVAETFYLHPRENLSISYQDKVIGYFGTLHPQVASHFGIKGNCVVGEISISEILKAKAQTTQFKPFGKFGSTSREMNILVEEGVTHEQILTWMPLAKAKNLEQVKLNSIYQGKEIGEGKKAMHYSFIYRNAEKTLTDKEVNKVQERIAKTLSEIPEISFK